MFFALRKLHKDKGGKEFALHKSHSDTGSKEHVTIYKPHRDKGYDLKA
jgi:hypothetical protein